MHKGNKFEWDVECQECFHELKNRLTIISILTLPLGIFVYKIHTDAYQKRLGCVLMQYGKVIAYGSK